MNIAISKLGSSRIKIHIVHQISPDKSAKKTKYRGFELSAYFFIPNTLVSGSGEEFDGSQTLSPPIVFPKIQRKNYYEIFAMDLTAILDSNNSLSPLARLEYMAQKVILPAENVFYEFQMLLCVTLKTCTKAYKKQLQRMCNSGNSEKNQKMCNELRGEVENELRYILQAYLQIQFRLEQLGKRYVHEITHNISESYQWAIEDLNHQIINWIQKILRLSNHHPFSQEFQEDLFAKLEQQWLYQKKHGFSTLSNLGNLGNLDDSEYHNESYLFHQRELKAWRYGGLSMFSTEARHQNVMNHFWPAMASAVAMIFALTVTLISMNYYGQWSTPFLVFAVLGYMFKDRIKEILRNLFSSKFSNYNLLRLYDPRSKKQCGSIRESLDVCDVLPVNIVALRQLYKHPLSIMYNNEVVISYREKFKINSKKLFQTHKRLQRGCQVLEFSLRPYLQNIKETETKQFWYHKNLNNISYYDSMLFRQPINIKRSYHLTLIIKVKTSCRQEIQQRYRIVLRGKKIAWIKRIC